MGVPDSPGASSSDEEKRSQEEIMEANRRAYMALRARQERGYDEVLVLTSSHVSDAEAQSYAREKFDFFVRQGNIQGAYEDPIELHCGFPVSGDKISQESFEAFLEERGYRPPKYKMDGWPFQDASGGYGFLIVLTDVLPGKTVVDLGSAK